MGSSLSIPSVGLVEKLGTEGAHVRISQSFISKTETYLKQNKIIPSNAIIHTLCTHAIFAAFTNVCILLFLLYYFYCLYSNFYNYS